MPRKKSDAAADVLEYFKSQPYEVVKVVLSLATSVVKDRAPQVVKPTGRRKPQPPATPPLSPVPDGAQSAIPALPGGNVVKVKRKRRTQAEMTQGLPVVPLQASVGDDDQNQNDQE